jgi:hypothetical protein
MFGDASIGIQKTALNTAKRPNIPILLFA